VAQDSATTDSRAETAAGRLKAIRARVAELHRRIKTERDPKAVDELRGEVGKLTELLSELARPSAGVANASPVVWPRDLNTAEARDAAEWGADPAEVAGG
jgi:hypothetical protein